MDSKNSQQSHAANPSGSELCRGGCGFFGNPHWNGFCSQCKSRYLERLQEIQTPNGGRLSPSALSGVVAHSPSTSSSRTSLGNAHISGSQTQLQAAVEQLAPSLIPPAPTPDSGSDSLAQDMDMQITLKTIPDPIPVSVPTIAEFSQASIGAQDSDSSSLMSVDPPCELSQSQSHSDTASTNTGMNITASYNTSANLTTMTTETNGSLSTSSSTSKVVESKRERLTTASGDLLASLSGHAAGPLEQFKQQLSPGGRNRTISSTVVELGKSPSSSSLGSSKNKCGLVTCRAKLKPAEATMVCRCGGVYCAAHRYSSAHSCTFDYRKEAADKIRKDNPTVVAERVGKI